MREWLEGLAKSANERNARMGRWYLRQLQEAAEAPVFVAWDSAGGAAAASVAGNGLVVYVNPELQRVLVEAARGWRRKRSAAMPLRLAVWASIRGRRALWRNEHGQAVAMPALLGWRDIVRYRRTQPELKRFVGEWVGKLNAAHPGLCF